MLNKQDFSLDRSKTIGGSDVGPVLGFSRFRSPLEVWMEKTGKGIKQPDSLPLRFGSFAEEFVASEYARSTGFELIHDESIHIHPEHSFMSAHIDRLVLDSKNRACANATPGRILECKTANPFTHSQWGEPGTDQVPMGYLCQCIWYMAITNMKHCDLAVLFSNSDFRIYEIKRDLELEALVTEKVRFFWNEYVLKDTPPPAQSEADCQALFGRGDPSKSAEAKAHTLELIQRLQLLNNEIDQRQDEVSSIKQVVMSQMGEAEILTLAGKVLATWRAPKPSYKIDSTRLEAEHPDLVNAYKIPVRNSRRLVIKPLD
jgi:putative phage-type endonuclease